MKKFLIHHLFLAPFLNLLNLKRESKKTGEGNSNKIPDPPPIPGSLPQSMRSNKTQGNFNRSSNSNVDTVNAQKSGPTNPTISNEDLQKGLKSLKKPKELNHVQGTSIAYAQNLPPHTILEEEMEKRREQLGLKSDDEDTGSSYSDNSEDEQNKENFLIGSDSQKSTKTGEEKGNLKNNHPLIMVAMLRSIDNIYDSSTYVQNNNKTTSPSTELVINNQPNPNNDSSQKSTLTNTNQLKDEGTKDQLSLVSSPASRSEQPLYGNFFEHYSSDDKSVRENLLKGSMIIQNNSNNSDATVQNSLPRQGGVQHLVSHFDLQYQYLLKNNSKNSNSPGIRVKS